MILINILLVDDHTLFAQSLSIALEDYSEIENFYATLEIDNLDEVMKEKSIDILLMDINLGNLCDKDGLEVASQIQKSNPEIKIIILTGYDLPVYRYEAKKVGAAGFLNKNITPDNLVSSLLLVSKGGNCFPMENNEVIIEELTSMEKILLQLVCGGKKRKCIAEELYISERTLSNHLQHIFEKLEVTSAVEAVAKAIKLGYIAPEYD